jgi:misacylated tRNA(Ala) deacylase
MFWAQLFFKGPIPVPKDYDPRMHSAEHILNQTMVRMFNCGRSFSAHVEREKSRCYYHFDHALSSEEVRQIESAVNDVIALDLAVTEEFMDRPEAERQFSLKRLPEDAGESLRIVRIGDYDACPCIGQHVSRTREIGSFEIYSHSFEDGVLKLRFRLGSRESHLTGPGA